MKNRRQLFRDCRRKYFYGEAAKEIYYLTLSIVYRIIIKDKNHELSNFKKKEVTH